jgi:co-chaperonin GroES (HSP10)
MLYTIEIPDLEVKQISRLIPVNGQVLVVPIAFPKAIVSGGGIMMSVEGDEDPNNTEVFPIRLGKILELGKDIEDEGHFKKGDIVYFSKYGGNDLDIGTQTLMQLKMFDIMGKADCEYYEKK